MESVIIVHFSDFCCPFHTQEIWCQPFHNTHLTPFVSSFCHENTSLRPRSAGVSHREGWKTTAILQNQDFCLIYLYTTWALQQSAASQWWVLQACIMPDKQNQTTDTGWQKGRVFLPPLTPDIQVQGTENDTQQFQMGFTLHFSISHTRILKWNLWYMGTKKPTQAMLGWQLQQTCFVLSSWWCTFLCGWAGDMLVCNTPITHRVGGLFLTETMSKWLQCLNGWPLALC